MQDQEIPLTKIKPNPFQSRTEIDKKTISELARSIKEQGLINPITVRTDGNGVYELVAGQRRLAAHKLLGKRKIRAVVRNESVDKTIFITISENLQREDINPMQQAMAFQKAIDLSKCSPSELARRIGKDKNFVYNHLTLLKLPKYIQDEVYKKNLDYVKAVELKKISDDAKKCKKIFNKVLSKGLTKEQIRSEVQRETGVSRWREGSLGNAKIKGYKPNGKNFRSKKVRGIALKSMYNAKKISIKNKIETLDKRITQTEQNLINMRKKRKELMKKVLKMNEKN